MPTVPAAIDYLALIDPISAEEVASLRAEKRTYPAYSDRLGGTQVVLVILLVAAAALFVVTFGGSLARQIALFYSGDATLNVISTVIVGLCLSIVLVLVFLGPVRTALRSGGRWARWARLNRFARANDFDFSPRGYHPTFPGSIFTIGDQRNTIDHFTAASEFDYGNYRYVTGKGDKKQTHNWGYLAIQLDRALPHMVLDARGNNGLFNTSNLPVAFAANQVLDLEGDFPKYFTLYCPREYERDALYVFTPDLMALLVDEAATFDVEVIDKWLFVYSAKPFNLLDPAVHQRLLRIVSTVGAKLRSQSRRYVDDHVREFAPNIIAPQGRRLRQGVSIGAIALVAVWVVYAAVAVFMR